MMCIRTFHEIDSVFLPIFRDRSATPMTSSSSEDCRAAAAVPPAVGKVNEVCWGTKYLDRCSTFKWFSIVLTLGCRTIPKVCPLSIWVQTALNLLLR